MTRVFVMAAGKGTRLAPWTNVVPKPVLPVANEPALGFLLRALAQAGMRDVVANASWKAELLTGIIGDGSAWGVNMQWSVESAPLGTAGGVLAARELLDDGSGAPVLVLSGDGVHDVDLAAFARAHERSGAAASMALLPVADPSQYGVAVVDAGGRVTRFQEKPAPGTQLSSLANTGIYLVSPQVLDMCTAWGLTDFGSELFPRLVADGVHVHGHTLDGTYWNDIGDLDEWRATCWAIVGGEVRTSEGPWSADDGGAPGVLVHPSARVDAGATVEGPCVIGADVHVQAGAHLRSALVLPGTVVPSGVTIASGTIGSIDGLERWAQSLCS
jgi:NDP-sugar pyrophosphorylase family protein